MLHAYSDNIVRSCSGIVYDQWQFEMQCWCDCWKINHLIWISLDYEHLLYCLTFFLCCLLLCDTVHLLLICWLSVGFEYVWLIVFTIMMKWLPILERLKDSALNQTLELKVGSAESAGRVFACFPYQLIN